MSKQSVLNKLFFSKRKNLLSKVIPLIFLSGIIIGFVAGLNKLANLSLIGILLITSLLIYFNFWVFFTKKSLREYSKEIYSKLNAQSVTGFFLFIAAFLYPPEERDNKLGDMVERHQLDIKRLGQSRALCVLAWDIAKSFFPILWFAVRTFFIKIFKLVGLYQLYRTFFG